MTQASAPSLKQVALADLSHEIATTRRVLARVPDEHLGWRPHPKSFSLGELSIHIANLLYWQVGMVERDEFDLATLPPNSTAPASSEELMRRFDESAEALRRALEGADDAALLAPWTLRRGEHVVLQQPRVGVMRSMGINHIVHHRGQLSVYLRLLNVAVPPIYGPTADEAP